jgi:hypothetical protein
MTDDSHRLMLAVMPQRAEQCNDHADDCYSGDGVVL